MIAAFVFYFLSWFPPSLFYSFTIQSDFSSVVMTRSGLSLEELRIVEGQGQSSEVITPSEEMNRINDMGECRSIVQLAAPEF